MGKNPRIIRTREVNYVKRPLTRAASPRRRENVFIFLTRGIGNSFVFVYTWVRI